MTKAQYAISDTIRTERIVVKSAQFGISLQNNLDTYLSNYNYKGAGIHFNHESFRDARTGNLLNDDILCSPLRLQHPSK